MPTKKPSRHILFDEDELRRLLKIWKELRKPGRRGLPEYIGQRLTFNQWLSQLTVERAAQVGLGLAPAAAAPTSGTVERPMTKTALSSKTTKSPHPSKAASGGPRRARPIEEPPKKRGRPPGRGPGKTKGHYNASLPLDIIEWLRSHPDGPAAVMERALRREQERESKAAAKK